VDVAGDEHHVLDLAGADVLEQLLALLRVALPAVELVQGLAGFSLPIASSRTPVPPAAEW
jgi:hypothetical protein